MGKLLFKDRLQGPARDYLPYFESAAQQAGEMNAATAAATFGWNKPEDVWEGDEYVPEITVRVRRADSLGDG